MNRKQISYRAIFRSSATTFERDVNDLMKKGYSIYGDIFYDVGSWMAHMVLYEEPDTDYEEHIQ